MPTITNFGDVVTQGNTTCQQQLTVQGSATFQSSVTFSAGLGSTTGSFSGQVNALSLNATSNISTTSLNVGSVANIASLNVSSGGVTNLFVTQGSITNGNVTTLNVSSLANVALLNASTISSLAFVGVGSGLSQLNASNISSGSLLGTRVLGNTLSNLNASNVAIGALAATYLQAAQTNITSVGTLTSLAVTGQASAGWLVGSGNTLSNLNASNIAIGALAATYLQAAQTNITSVGTLTSLAVTGAASAGWLVGSGNTLSNLNASNVAIGALGATYLQAAQTNITSVGTLASLAVTGAASAGWHVGSGNTLSNLNASNVTIGALGATYLQAAQTNITSVGTLTSLAVTGQASAGWLVGSGNTLSNLNASNVAIGALGATYLQAAQTNITSVGTLTSLSVTGAASAGWHVGGGNTMSNLNASNVTIGALGATYLQAAQTNITSVGTLGSLAVTGAASAGWLVGSGNTLSNLNASNVAIGALGATYLQAAQTNITSVGTLTSLAVTGAVSAGWHVGGGNTLSNLNASNITGGTLTLTTPITGSVFIGAGNALSNVSGVGAGTYGTIAGTQYPVITVDANGRITSITNQGVQGTQWSGPTGNWIYYTSNNVGIATSTPLTSLDVRGNTYVLANLASWYSLTSSLGAFQVYSLRNENISASGTGTTILSFDSTLLPPGVTGSLYVKYSTGSGSVYFVKNGAKTYNLSTNEAVVISGVSSSDSSAQLTLKFYGTGSITYSDVYFVADTLQISASNVAASGNLAVTREVSASYFIGGGNVLSNINGANVIGAIVVTQVVGGANAMSNINASNISFGNLLGSWVLGNTLSNINVSNISGYVTGNALSNLNASNIAIGALAATYLQAVQTNITSVGTLTSLAVTGQASAGWLVGGGNTLSNLNASNVTFGSLNGSWILGNTLSNINVSNISGYVTGNALSNINASNVAFGNLNGSWILGNTLSNVNASNIAYGNLNGSWILGNTLSNINGANVIGAIVVTQVIGGGNALSNINASNVIFGNLIGSWILGNTLSNVNASNIAFGNLNGSWILGNTLSNLNASNVAIGALGATYLQAVQTNITSVGTLTSLAVTGAASAGWLVGSGNTLSNLNASNVAIGALGATYLQAAQTNITSVGTLTSLAVTGAASAGWHVGSGNTLSNLNASNVAIGALGATYLQAAQTNITSVGTLTSLAVTGPASAGWHVGSGNTLSNLNASNVAIGALGATYLQAAQTNITSVGTLTSLVVTGPASAGWLVGSGNTLSNLNASNVAIGALGATYLQAAQTNITSVGTLTSLAVTGPASAGWHVGGANTLSNVNASNVAIGALGATYLQAAQTNITSVGTLTSLAVTGAASAGWLVGSGNTLSNLNASNVAIGALGATYLQAAQTNITSVGTLTSLAVTGATSAGWLVGSGNTLSNLNASNVAIGALGATYLQAAQTNITSLGTLTSLAVTGAASAGWLVGSGNTLSNLNASNIAFGALAAAQLQSTQSNISSIASAGTGLTVSGSLKISALQIGGSPGSTNQVLQATGTGDGIQWGSISALQVSGNTLSNLNASNVAFGTFGNILTLANSAIWYELPAYSNVFQAYQVKGASVTVSGSSYGTAYTFSLSYLPPGSAGKFVFVYSSASGTSPTLYSPKTNSTYSLSVGGGRIEIPNISSADNPVNAILQFYGATTTTVTYTDVYFEAYAIQVLASNVVYGNVATSTFSNVTLYGNVTVGNVLSTTDLSVSSNLTVGSGVRLNSGSGSNIYASNAVSTTNVIATGGAIICSFPTRKFYSWSGVVSTLSAPTFTLTFGNYAFYAKIVALLLDTNGTVNSVSTYAVEAAGGSADGTSPSNSIVLGTKNLFGPTLSNPWSSTVSTTSTTVVFTPANSSYYSWQISVELIGSTATLTSIAQSVNPTTSKTFNY